MISKRTKMLTMMLGLLCLITLYGAVPAFADTPSGTSADGGWDIMESGSRKILIDVWGTSGSDVFAVGEEGTLLHYDGAAWSLIDAGTGYIINGVWGTSANNVYAVGYLGTIIHYDGSTWHTETANTRSCLFGIWGSSADNIYVIGDAPPLRWPELERH